MNETINIPPRRYTRRQLWEKLHELGLPWTWPTFQRQCCEGRRPEPVGAFGQRVLYTLEEGLAWFERGLKKKDAA